MLKYGHWEHESLVAASLHVGHIWSFSEAARLWKMMVDSSDVICYRCHMQSSIILLHSKRL